MHVKVVWQSAKGMIHKSQKTKKSQVRPTMHLQSCLHWDWSAPKNLSYGQLACGQNKINQQWPIYKHLLSLSVWTASLWIHTAGPVLKHFTNCLQSQLTPQGVAHVCLGNRSHISAEHSEQSVLAGLSAVIHKAKNNLILGLFDKTLSDSFQSGLHGE